MKSSHELREEKINKLSENHHIPAEKIKEIFKCKYRSLSITSMPMSNLYESQWLEFEDFLIKIKRGSLEIQEQIEELKEIRDDISNAYRKIEDRLKIKYNELQNAFYIEKEDKKEA